MSMSMRCVATHDVGEIHDNKSQFATECNLDTQCQTQRHCAHTHVHATRHLLATYLEFTFFSVLPGADHHAVRTTIAWAPALTATRSQSRTRIASQILQPHHYCLSRQSCANNIHSALAGASATGSVKVSSTGPSSPACPRFLSI